MKINLIILVSELILFQIMEQFNQNVYIYFRVEGGPVFGSEEGDPQRGAFAHRKSCRAIPYLYWNSNADRDQYAGHGAAGYVQILYSEESCEKPEGKRGDHPIDRGEVIIKRFEKVYTTGMLWGVEGSLKQQSRQRHTIWFDWGSLLSLSSKVEESSLED